jgi:hypothetical protein
MRKQLVLSVQSAHACCRPEYHCYYPRHSAKYQPTHLSAHAHQCPINIAKPAVSSSILTITVSHNNIKAHVCFKVCVRERLHESSIRPPPLLFWSFRSLSFVAYPSLPQHPPFSSLPPIQFAKRAILAAPITRRNREKQARPAILLPDPCRDEPQKASSRFRPLSSHRPPASSIDSTRTFQEFDSDHPYFSGLSDRGGNPQVLRAEQPRSYRFY